MNDKFLQLEAEVLQRLLTGEHPVLERLRDQLATSEINDRQFSGTGFYTHFKLDRIHLPRATEAKTLRIGDVAASVEELANGAGFVLFIEEGWLAFLEGYSFDEPWPQKITTFSTHYVGGKDGTTRDIGALNLG